MNVTLAKVCQRCRAFKLASAFVKNRSRRDGLCSYCKLCVATRARENRLDPEVLARHREKRRQWGQQNRNKTKAWARRYTFQTKYRLSMDRYDEMVTAQDGKCAICTLPTATLVVDHCHTTGAVRGLLCRTCNSGMGHLRDDPSLLLAAVRYLESHARLLAGLSR